MFIVDSFASVDGSNITATIAEDTRGFSVDVFDVDAEAYVNAPVRFTEYEDAERYAKVCAGIIPAADAGIAAVFVVIDARGRDAARR